MPVATTVTPGEQGLLMWTPGAIRCAGGVVPEGQPLRRPPNRLSNIAQPPAPVVLRFAIDATGRPLSIVRETAAATYPAEGSGPALAASRFALARPLADCVVTYSARFATLAQAPISELEYYGVEPQNGALPRSAWERVGGDGDCYRGDRPEPLLRGFPDTSRLPATPGVRDWSLIGYDIDKSGKPINIVQGQSTGNRALDAAAREALAKSRFAGGARTGCDYPYRRPAGVLAAPPAPDVEEADEGPCASEGGWALEPRKSYPLPYSNRAIEGWAVMEYDVATWGEIGNVRILAAQPSMEFGQAAKRMLEAARRPSGPGETGCRTVVRYRIAPEGAGDS